MIAGLDKRLHEDTSKILEIDISSEEDEMLEKYKNYQISKEAAKQKKSSDKLLKYNSARKN